MRGVNNREQTLASIMCAKALPARRGGTGVMDLGISFRTSR